MAAMTRKVTDVWLIGPRASEITGCKLPSKRQVMALFFHHHLTEGKPIRESATLVTESVLTFWERARIPTRKKQHVIALIEKIHDDWRKLKKNKENKAKRSESLVKKEGLFSDSLDALFDIAHQDALKLIKIEEDRRFLLAQRQKGRPGSMGSVDRTLAKKEERAHKRKVSLLTQREKEQSQIQKATDKGSISESDKEEEDVERNIDDVEYTEAPTSSTPTQSTSGTGEVTVKAKRARKDIMTPDLAAVLDRTKVSDRNATFLLATTAKQLGHDVNELSINRSTVRRQRLKFRENIAEKLKAEFEPTVPLIVHWDGKMLSAITGKEVVDRLPILVSGAGIDQLLSVPMLPSGTGQNTALAVHEAVTEWGVQDQVKGMCFDTTSSNTGYRSGACILFQQMVGKDLLHLGCRHHVHEIILEAVFHICMGPSSGPDIPLFKRFQAQWPFIDQTQFVTAVTSQTTCDLVNDISANVIAFANEQLEQFQPRDDYRELLELTIIFLGMTPSRGVRFQAPGAMHRARWMAKGIYSLKVWMFREQFKLTARDEKALLDISLFIVRFYVKAWYLAPCSIRAPSQDLQLLQELDKYKQTSEKIGQATVKKLLGQLWYLSEELVGLAFFDSTVSHITKRKMVQALNNESEEEPLKRAVVDANAIQDKGLENFVTSNTRRFFAILGLEYGFILTDPSEWDNDEEYLHAKNIVSKIRVVNDIAERGVALMEEYNLKHTRDEGQKQYLLQVVAEHRRQFPDCKKRTLTK